MPTRIEYESTIAPASIEVAAGTLGKRDSTALALAFDTPSAPPEGDGGAPRSTATEQRALLDLARRKMGEYTGSSGDPSGNNEMFPQYRRNFIPAGGTLTEEYVGVRNKTMSPDEVRNLKLGTPYSPTIASPGVQHKLDPAGLASVPSTVNGITYAAGTPLAEQLDPDSEMHRNRDATGAVDNVGQVRRFKIGVASGTSIENPRGQFPDVT
jgi:hypothetical protein